MCALSPGLTKITMEIDANMKITNYLYVNLNLKTDGFISYKKPNSETNCIHRQKNHSPSYIKNVPKASIPEYLETQNAPKYSTSIFTHMQHNSQSTFKESARKTNQKDSVYKRRRKTTWFNPPFNINVATNVTIAFLSIDKRFYQVQQAAYLHQPKQCQSQLQLPT